MAMSLTFLMGCAPGWRPVLESALLSNDDEVLSTQMLKPGVLGESCAWSAAWRRSDGVGRKAVEAALEDVPEATVLRGATVEARILHLGAVVRQCVRVRGDATRPIGEVRLPLVGGAHAPHH